MKSSHGRGCGLFGTYGGREQKMFVGSQCRKLCAAFAARLNLVDCLGIINPVGLLPIEFEPKRVGVGSFVGI